jgi:hypothetical protein
MIWTCADLIRFFSINFTLKRGMMTITGTPSYRIPSPGPTTLSDVLIKNSGSFPLIGAPAFSSLCSPVVAAGTKNRGWKHRSGELGTLKRVQRVCWALLDQTFRRVHLDLEQQTDIDYVSVSAGVHHSWLHWAMTFEQGWGRELTRGKVGGQNRTDRAGSVGS